MQFLLVQIQCMLNLCHVASNIFTITILVFLMYTDISAEYVGMFMIYFPATFLMPSSEDS